MQKYPLPCAEIADCAGTGARAVSAPVGSPDLLKPYTRFCFKLRGRKQSFFYPNSSTLNNLKSADSADFFRLKYDILSFFFTPFKSADFADLAVKALRHLRSTDLKHIPASSPRACARLCARNLDISQHLLHQINNYGKPNRQFMPFCQARIKAEDAHKAPSAFSDYL